MLAPNPQASVSTASWPIPGDAPDLLTIVQDQASTIMAQEALLHAYQSNLTAAQHPNPGTVATATATASGTPATSLTVSAVTGTIIVGSALTDGALVPANTTILGQISGTTGGAGVYLTSNPTTTSATAVTFTPPLPPFSVAWPTPQDAVSLDNVLQIQTAVLRTQSSLIQHYQDLLSSSGTPAPPTGP